MTSFFFQIIHHAFCVENEFFVIISSSKLCKIVIELLSFSSSFMIFAMFFGDKYLILKVFDKILERQSFKIFAEKFCVRNQIKKTERIKKSSPQSFTKVDENEKQFF